MSWLRNRTTGELRIICKLLLFLGVALLAALALMAMAFPVLAFVPGAQTPVVCLALLLAGLVATWVCVDRLERQSIRAAGIGLDRPWVFHLLIGAAGGVAAIGVCWAVYLAAGWATLTVPTYTVLDLALVLVALLTLAAAAGVEELLARGYPFQILARWNLPFAVIFMGVLFSGSHLLNPGAVHPVAMVNLFLAHLILALAYLRTRSLWLPIGIHFGWNFGQGCIFGLPVSGVAALPTLLATDVQPNHWTGHSFGPEGGLTATVVGSAAIVLMLWRMPQRLPQPDLMRKPPPTPEQAGAVTEVPAE